MGIEAEIAVKEERVRRLMEVEGLDAVILTRQDNFAWFTAGGDNHVAIGADTGAASVVVTKNAKYIVTTNIEAARIMEEEVPGQGFELVNIPWQTGGVADEIARIVGDGKAATDTGMMGLPDVAERVAELRWYLTPEEVDRYRWLGERTEAAMNKVCKSLKPGMTENEIAAQLSLELQSQGVVPAVLLMAADARIERYRHPVAKDTKVTRCTEVVVCAKKWGLILSCTRMVYFGKLPDELRKKHDAVVRIDAALNLSTEVNRPLKDILMAGLKEYEASGYADEWRLHHQGGPTGYAGRDYLATPDEARKVLPNQAFAWNPSITGTKSEDTIIATEAGIEWLSLSTDWPMIEVPYEGSTVMREDILVL